MQNRLNSISAKKGFRSVKTADPRAMKKKAYQILLIAPPLDQQGGVADFCRMLSRHLNSSFCVSHLEIGSKGKNKGLWHRLLLTAFDGSQLFIKILSQKFDVIHINPSFSQFSLLRDGFFLFLINLLRLHPKTIVFFHGWDQTLAERITRKILLKKVFQSIFRKPSRIIVLFQRCQEQLISLGIPPCKIMIGTTMYERFENSAGNGFIRKSNDAKIRILFMARLLKEKGVFIAAKVAQLLLHSGFRDFRLIFAGTGREYKNLKSFITQNDLAEYVETSGFVWGEEKKKVLATSDIFLFPTYYGEGCPVVVLEAMGAGLAIISTAVGAIPDIVKQNENGFIINSKNPVDFARAIEILLEDRKLLRTIQEANRKKAEENFEASIVTRKVESIYLSIICA